MEIQMSHSISPVTLLAALSRALELGGVSATDARVLRGVLTLELTEDEVCRLTQTLERGDLRGFTVEPNVGCPRKSRLVLSRRVGESVLIGGDVVVSLDRVRGQAVRLRIDAPHHVRVMRCELLGYSGETPGDSQETF